MIVSHHPRRAALYRHRDRKRATLSLANSSPYKCPLPQPLSFDIPTNARGVHPQFPFWFTASAAEHFSVFFLSALSPRSQRLSVIVSPAFSSSTLTCHQIPAAPVFSFTYELPIFYLLCFDIHACNGGGCTPLNHALCSLFAPRAFHNSFAIKGIRTLSQKCRVYTNSSHSGTPGLTISHSREARFRRKLRHAIAGKNSA